MNKRLGHYDIVEELGRGGMGVVYKGYESSLGRYVAIKVLSAAMAHDEVFVERFLREARSMATLNDSHIIQIYFIGQDEEQTFFVMEYIDGESLSSCIKREKRLTTADALKIVLHTSQGLAAAHAHGVIHRDIKPGNIMVTNRGQVKVADFGIALANHDVSSKLTNTGAFVGTPGYLSPEVCMGKPVDQRSDIFALGIVLFEMLSGRMPFEALSPLQLMLDVVQTAMPDIRELNPDVDDESARILERMVAKDPAERYQSCDELKDDLKRHPLLLEGRPLQLRPTPWAGANASNPTVVGAPTPLTPGHSPRQATPPPMVNSARTPAYPQQPVTGSNTLPPPARSLASRVLWPTLALGAFAALGWVILGPAQNAPVSAPIASTVAPPPVPPSPPAPGPVGPGTKSVSDLPAAVATPATADAKADAKADSKADATADAKGKPTAPTAVATVRYGHGGKNSRINRVRVRPVLEPSAADIAREEARKQNLAAALAATEAQSAPAAPAATAPEAKKRGFLCKVFKKCDPPPAKKPAEPKPSGNGG